MAMTTTAFHPYPIRDDKSRCIFDLYLLPTVLLRYLACRRGECLFASTPSVVYREERVALVLTLHAEELCLSYLLAPAIFSCLHSSSSSSPAAEETLVSFLCPSL